MSVVGFENIYMLNMTSPRLTTIAQDFDKLGDACGEILLERIEKGPTKELSRIKIPTHLVAGETCSAISLEA